MNRSTCKSALLAVVSVLLICGALASLASMVVDLGACLGLKPPMARVHIPRFGVGSKPGLSTLTPGKTIAQGLILVEGTKSVPGMHRPVYKIRIDLGPYPFRLIVPEGVLDTAW